MLLKKLAFLLICLGWLGACATHEPLSSVDLKQALLHASGLDQWDRVQKITFTFHVRKPGQQIRRTWTWWPHRDEVQLTYGGLAQPLRYFRSEIADASHTVQMADRWFVNDRFWLLTPLYLSEAQGVTLEDQGISSLPIGTGQARQISAQFSEQGGYTPGDRYELFLSEDHLIRQWTYYRGGEAKPTLTCTFATYTSIDGLRLAMDHKDAVGQFQVWFTSVGVKMSKSLDR